MPPVLSKTFNIPSTGEGTFILLNRCSETSTGELRWYIEDAQYLDNNNNITNIKGYNRTSMNITRENGMANVVITVPPITYNNTLRCCFIPGNPFESS